MPSAVPIDAGDEDRGEADDDRHARAEDQPREHVASQVVGAEQVLGAAARLPGRRAEPSPSAPTSGSTGAMTSAKIATKASAAGCDGDDGKAAHAERGEAPRQGQSGRGSAGLMTTSGRLVPSARTAGWRSSLVADPRVDHRVENVDQQVDDDDHGAGEQHRGLHDGERASRPPGRRAIAMSRTERWGWRLPELRREARLQLRGGMCGAGSWREA